jgi:hypothetical protein
MLEEGRTEVQTVVDPGREVFEVSFCGGRTEDIYRKLRPEIERLPWRRTGLDSLGAKETLQARRAWTQMSLQEYSGSASHLAIARALVRAQAPVDLCAAGIQFAQDELVHAEICARMAVELGGGVAISYDREQCFPIEGDDDAPLQRAADGIMGNYCVGEAWALPMAKAVVSGERNALLRGVRRRLVRDEVNHGRFGWLFLDWMRDQGLLTAAERGRLGIAAGRAVRHLRQRLAALDLWPDDTFTPISPFGEFNRSDYQTLGERCLVEAVLTPLLSYGIEPATV